MDPKDQIIRLAVEIGELNSRITDQWLEVQKRLGDGQGKDEAISLLNTYFRMRANLEGAESRLKSMLQTHFPDK